MASTINWGIIGLGRIARKFADDLKRVPNSRLHAVASTDTSRARAFADEFGATHAYGNYEAMANCPNLDVVYIATPHTLHAAVAMITLNAGIATLVEKPFAMHYGEAIRMVETARRHRAFLMEALWTRFIPGVQFALDQAEQGAVGPIHTVKSDFGFRTAPDPSSRLFNPALGGGSLLDIGIYPTLLALSVFGKPEDEHIQAAATFTPAGVDESCAFSFQYPGNRLAIGHSTLAAFTPIEAYLYGSEGHIYLHPRWHHTQKVSITKYIDGKQQEPETQAFPYEGWGYQFEAEHVMQCMEEGWMESDIVPLDFSLDLCATLDAIRERIGLRY